MLKTLKSNIIFILLIILATAPVACSKDKLAHSTKMNVLNTYADVTIAGEAEQKVKLAIADVEQELKIINHISYTFHEDSELRLLNTAISNGESITVSDEMIDLINTSKRLSKLSGGLFNPAAGELTALWEFHCETNSCTESPFPEEVSKLVAAKEQEVIASNPTMSDIKINGNTVSTTNKSIKLEFGDIIRGYALDKSIQHLRALNINNAMVEIGEDVRIIGHKNERPWWVGIQDARGEHLLGTIELKQDSAIITSHALAKSIDKQGSIYRHVVNPETGMPVKSISTVTVLHENGAMADVAATALLVAGIEGWYKVADALNVTAILMYTNDGTLYLSPAMADKIHWKQEVPHKLLIPRTNKQGG